MKSSNKGSIYGTIIGIAVAIPCIVYCYFFPQRWHMIVLPLFYIPLGFWLGLLYDRVNFLANYDVLTNVANRRMFEKVLSRYLNQAARSKLKLSLIFIDVDNFKQINDICGHELGDTALKEIAKKIKANLRPADIVGRIGGDEFVILCCNISNEESSAIIERIKKSVSEVTIGKFKLSISAGAAVYPEDGISTEELIRTADLLMYDNKSHRKAVNSFS